MNKTKVIRIGTRASALALAQTNIVINELKKHHNCEVEIVKITTSGDKIKDVPLYEIGGKALFIKEIEEALLNDNIDIAVHSLKDMPGNISPEFKISATLKRDTAVDCLISKVASSISTLPHGATVGTCSPRRIIQIRNMRPDINILPLRGNVPTRIDKLYAGEYDAIVLAAAGLERLKMNNQDCHLISADVIIPAVGQGAIGIEILNTRDDLHEMFQPINDQETFFLTSIERLFLETLNANCKTPIACYAAFTDDTQTNVLLTYMLGSDNMHDYKVQDKVTFLSTNAHNILAKITSSILQTR